MTPRPINCTRTLSRITGGCKTKPRSITTRTWVFGPHTIRRRPGWVGGLGHFQLRQGTVIEQIQSGSPPPDMMIFHDPPRHEQLRRLVGRAFTPRRVAELDTKIRLMCADWLDPLVESPGAKVWPTWRELPMAVIAALLGAPAEDNHRLKALSDRLLDREDGSMAMPDDGRAAGAEIYVYFSELIASRRKRPADDLTTALTQAEIVGSDGESERLTDDEIVAFCLLLGVAGNETTAKMIATG